MRFRVYKALARGVILESLRRKDLWVVAILGFVIMLAAGLLGFFGTQGLEAFVKDLAVTVLGLFSTIVAVLTASRMLPEEIKQRTLYPLLSRPISRLDLLIGKLFGAIAVTWIAFLMLAALTGIALATFHVGFETLMLQYLVAKMLGLALVCTVTMTLSIYMTPAGAATMSLVFAFGSSMIVRALVMGYEGSPAPMQLFFTLLNAALPQYGLFDLGGRAANTGWSPVPLWVFGALLAYLMVYGAATMSVGWLKFRKQAI